MNKKAKNLSEKGRDINGLAVQQELLKILEPSKVSIFHDSMTFDTSRLTLIQEGAFVGLEDIVQERIHPTHIGFGNDELDHEHILDFVEPEDIIKYGFINEFVGRAPNPVVMKKLSLDTILDIIYAKLEKQRTIFDSKQFRLQIDPAVLTEIAYRVLSHDTGARDVKKELDALLYEAKYHLYNVPSNGECVIDAQGTTSFLYEDKKTKRPMVESYPGPAYLQENDE